MIWRPRNPDPEFIGEPLQLAFPQTHARAVAAATIGGDQQTLCQGVANTTDVLPPAADRLHGESRRIIVNADIHPTRVGGKIINSVRHGAAEVIDQKIVHAHVLRLALGSPFPTGVLEIADQFLLLRVHGDHRLVLGQGRLNRVVDEMELGVAVGIVGALERLAIGLQGELLFLQQFANHRVADLVAELFQFSRKSAQALTGPAQRRHRIASRTGLDQPIQVLQQSGIRRAQRFAPASGAANSARR